HHAYGKLSRPAAMGPLLGDRGFGDGQNIGVVRLLGTLGHKGARWGGWRGEALAATARG
ncbi:unnamed protein product, partial [Phaeothamnion confervicola]